MRESAWELVDAFFDKYNLVDHHLESYNDFVNNRIQEIIDTSLSPSNSKRENIEWRLEPLR